MKKVTLSFVVMAAIAMSLFSCNNSGKQNSTVTQDSTSVVEAATNSFIGTYQGTLPCADCEGIKTTLTLNNDSTYSLKSEYLGKKGETFDENGEFNVTDNQVVVLTATSGEKTYYKILNGEVALSDSLGQINDGELAENYKLKKQ